MGIRLAVAVLGLAVAMTAQAGEEIFDVKKELFSDYLRDWLGTEVKLYPANAETPPFVEVTRPDLYTAYSVSPSLFGGGRRHCLDAFQKAAKKLVDHAAAHGYDAVVDIRPESAVGNPADAATLKCTPGYKVTTVSLSASLAMSAAARQRELDAEAESLRLPPRKPADGAIFLSMEPILASAEGKAIFAEQATLYWGTTAPAYSHRYGPDDYYDEAPLTDKGPENACKEAALNVLRAIAKEAKSHHFDSIIKVRSRLDEEYAPAPGDLECRVGKKKATVTLQATLAQRQPPQ